jgi:hypothetical protein
VDNGTGPLGAGRREVALAALAAARPDEGVDGLPAILQRICRAAVASTGMAGAAVHLLNRADGGGVVVASDATARAVAEATFSTGEGPSLDAYSQARPVFAPYLVDQGQRMWPAFVNAVRASGILACCSLPLHVGAVRLGVLDLYATTPGPMDPDQISVALTFADLALERLLEGEQVDSARSVNARLVEAVGRRGEIHQAQGMVTVDLGVDLAEALSLMRAHAFSRDLSLLDVAREILAGTRLPAPGPASGLPGDA